MTGDGILHEVAKTDSWPMLESIGERQGVPLEADDLDFVSHSLVADSAAVVLLRNYLWGARRLSLRTFDAGTLGVVRDDRLDRVTGGHDAGDAGSECSSRFGKLVGG